MNDTPFFTIGIASYNYAGYITHGLNQLKNQKFKDFEILISDDGSSDNSVQVIQAFKDANPQMNIRLIVKATNEGLINNKNTIIENARGKYLMLCDADDWMSDNYLQIAYNKIQEENPDRLICDVCHIGKNNKEIQVEHIPPKQTKWGWLIHHGSFYKMDIIRSYNIRITGEPDDVYFILPFAKYSKKIAIINEQHYYWFVHNDSEGRKKRWDFNDTYFEKYFISEKKFVIDLLIDIKKQNEKGLLARQASLTSKEVGECDKKPVTIVNTEDSLERDYDELKLVFLKLYCRDILFRLQKVGIKDKYKYYNKLKKYCRSSIPEMWECKSLRGGKNKVMRSFALIVIQMCKFLEKTYLMYPFLLVYHLVTKVVSIDQ